MSGTHTPVMLAEVLHWLAPADGQVIVDATFGGGGYSRAILDHADCAVLAIDRDPDAIARAEALATAYPGRLTPLQGRFGALETLVRATGLTRVDAVVFDLGLSSFQLDEGERGFSYRADAPLDMRMSGANEGSESAADFLAAADEATLSTVIHDYGEERRARAVAKAIVAARAEAPVETTGRLAAIVRRVVKPAKDGIDPATRTFQALRVHINDELGEIGRGLSAAERMLRPGGRLVVVAFHSLEDRAVKNFMHVRAGRASGASRHTPAPQMPLQPSLRLLNRKPETPGSAEVSTNPRARSAKLRAAERTDAPPFPDTAKEAA